MDTKFYHFLKNSRNSLSFRENIIFIIKVLCIRKDSWWGRWAPSSAYTFNISKLDFFDFLKAWFKMYNILFAKI